MDSSAIFRATEDCLASLERASGVGQLVFTRLSAAGKYMELRDMCVFRKSERRAVPGSVGAPTGSPGEAGRLRAATSAPDTLSMEVISTFYQKMGVIGRCLANRESIC